MISTAKIKEREMPDRNTNAKKKPCGKCLGECKTTVSVPCNFCETWFHAACVDGMTAAFVECSDAMMLIYGTSSYLCHVCRKGMTKLIIADKDKTTLIRDMQAELKKGAEERKMLNERIDKLEGKTKQVKEKVVVMEREMETGMEQAVKEIREEVVSDKKEADEIANNIVIYGLKESEKEEGKDRKEDDKQMVKKILDDIEVEIDEAMEVKWRAGKKNDDPTKQRPLIVKMESEEKKEKVLKNAKKLKGKAEWAKVFIQPDLTYRQRVEARKQEEKLKEEAEKKNEEGKNEEGESEGEWIVVGPRGKRRVAWKKERGERG